MLSAKEGLVVTNMYPSEKNYRGVFVKKNVDGLKKEFKIQLLNVEEEENKFYKFINYLKFYVELFQKLKKHSIFSFVYFHFPTRTALPLLFFNISSKVVLNFHGSDLMSDSFINKILLKILSNRFRKVKLIVVPSPYFKKIVEDKFGKDIEVFISPSSGVSDSFFNVGNNENDSIKNVITISSIKKDKGIFDLCEAIISLNKLAYNKNYFFYGLGSESDIGILKKYCKSCSNIFYKGYVDQKNIPELLKEFDLFVFPSRKESLGLVGIEALATGTPVVASNIPAITSYLKNGLNGLTFIEKDVSSLVEVLIELFEDHAFYNKLKNNTRKSVDKYRQSNVQLQLNQKLKNISS